jgi:DnaK suppressor protein
VTPDEKAAARRVLLLARDEASAALAALTYDLDTIVRASADANADDEHDPEGSTVAFERAQVTALLEGVRRDLAEIGTALDRVEAGGYGRCEECGVVIAPERLLVRPAARQCVNCASTHRMRR